MGSKKMPTKNFSPSVVAFRFYLDGPEDSSTPIGDENVNIVLPDGDQVNIQLRLSLLETGGGSGQSTDFYYLQTNKNDSGWLYFQGYPIGGDPDSSLVNGNLTTNRSIDGITDADSRPNRFVGSPCSIVGGQTPPYGIPGWAFPAGKFTEMLFAIRFHRTGFNSGDTIKFRMLINGLQSILNNVTPIVTIG